MICCLCPKVAWYLVGRRGYCGEHRPEAIRANAKRRNYEMGLSDRAFRGETSRLIPAGTKIDAARHGIRRGMKIHP